MVYISPALFKRQAREALRGHWLTALLIALVVNLPSLLVQGIAAFTGNDLLTRIQQAAYSAILPGGAMVDPNALLSGLREIEQSSGIWIMQGLNVAAWLLTPCLTLGMLAWTQGRLRGEEDPGFTAVFSRMRLFFKGIGLRLYVALRVFLWMLPGVALMILSLLPLWLSDRTSSLSILSGANTSYGLMTASTVVMAVLAVIAALKYALADRLLAETPEMKITAAAKKSKEITQGKKGLLFSLYISFVLWHLLAVMASTLCMDLLGPVAGLMIQMLASLAITAYLETAVSAFGLWSVRPVPLTPPEEEGKSLN